MKKNLFIIIAVILFVLAGGAFGWSFFNNKLTWSGPLPSSEPVYCTMEAKICPDGSYVGRIPPDCEFAPCPGEAGWKSSVDEKQGIAFSYPEKLDAEFIFTHEWPPAISLSNAKFVCQETDQASSLPERVSRVAVDGHTYCVFAKSEGAVGSTYTEFSYIFQLGEKILKMDFTLRYPNCGNYPEDNMIKCNKERSAFDLNKLVDEIARTINFNN